MFGKDVHMEQSIQKWSKYNLWKTAFKKFEGVWFALSRPCSFNFFKGCLPQVLLGYMFQVYFESYVPDNTEHCAKKFSL